MKTKRSFANALKALQRWQTILDRDKKKLCVEYVKEHCPHKVGDITDSKSKALLAENGEVKITCVYGKINKCGVLEWGVIGERTTPEVFVARIDWDEWHDEHFDTH